MDLKIIIIIWLIKCLFHIELPEKVSKVIIVIHSCYGISKILRRVSPIFIYIIPETFHTESLLLFLNLYVPNDVYIVNFDTYYILTVEMHI